MLDLISMVPFTVDNVCRFVLYTLSGLILIRCAVKRWMPPGKEQVEYALWIEKQEGITKQWQNTIVDELRKKHETENR